MMHTPMGKICCKIAWAITGIAAINMGLVPFGKDFLSSDWAMMHESMKFAVCYIVGIAGALSLVKLVMHCMHGDMSCSGAGCSRCGSMNGCHCNKQ